jgi:SAM-dependent methyltransferase
MKCLICQSETRSFHDEKSGLDYHHCYVCEFVFKDPSCYQSITDQKARYDLHENDEDDAGYRAYFQRFLDFVLPIVGSPETALDFGCGRSTLLANILNSMNIVTDVYDPIYHPEKQYDSKKYDLIVSTEVFEHLHDPDTLFFHLVSHLNEGGYLALQTQFHPNDESAFKPWYYHKDPTHIVFFRPKTFAVLAEKYSCKILADNGKNMIVLRKSKV